MAEPFTKQIHFTSEVMGPKAIARLKAHQVKQTLRSANEVRNWGLPGGRVAVESDFELILDGVVIGRTDLACMDAVHWHELDIGDARRGGFESLEELEKALKRAGFRYKDAEDYGFYRIQFTWRKE